MDIIMIAGFCLTACIVCKFLEKGSGEIKVLLAVCTSCIVIFKVLGEFSGITNAIAELFDKADMDDNYLTIIFKGLGVCYITQLSCDCCRDCGENAIATQLELAGRICILLISMPLFKALIGIIEALLT